MKKLTAFVSLALLSGSLLAAPAAPEKPHSHGHSHHTHAGQPAPAKSGAGEARRAEGQREAREHSRADKGRAAPKKMKKKSNKKVRKQAPRQSREQRQEPRPPR